MRTATEIGRTQLGDPLVSFGDVVQLYDTDASGLLYFGTATRWVTEATFELMRAIGRVVRFGTGFATPVRAAELEYVGMLRLGDEITVSAWFDQVGTTSFRVAVDVASTGTTRARMLITHVNVDMEAGSVAPVPPEIAALAVAGAPAS